MRYAQDVFDTIYNFTGFTDYAYQYNAEANFNDSICITEGNKRRRLLNEAVYIPSTIISIEGDIVNNLHRERSVVMHLNKSIPIPKTKDTSRQTISGFGICLYTSPQNVFTETSI